MRLACFGASAVAAVLLVSAPMTAARWFDPPPPTATPEPTPAAAPSLATPERACEIDVLEREPAVPFDLLAVVEVQARMPETDPESLVASARLRACELGGDALVILWRREPHRSGMAPRPGGQGLLPEPGLRTAVIRYR